MAESVQVVFGRSGEYYNVGVEETVGLQFCRLCTLAFLFFGPFDELTQLSAFKIYPRTLNEGRQPPSTCYVQVALRPSAHTQHPRHTQVLSLPPKQCCAIVDQFPSISTPCVALHSLYFIDGSFFRSTD